MKADIDQRCLESALQALGALEWILVRTVFDVRLRTATALKHHLARAGIEIPESITESSKWFRAFHGVLSVPNHKDGFAGLLRDRLLELGFEKGVVGNAIEQFEQDVAELRLDVRSAVARELCGELEPIGVRVPPSVLDSAELRDVFAREQGKLPPAAASIVQDGTVASVFQAIEEFRGLKNHTSGFR